MKSLLSVDLQYPRPVNRLRLIILAWTAVVFMTAAFLSFHAIAGQQVWTPPVGSSERKDIVNALRQEVKIQHGLDVHFVISHLKVKDNWAWLQTRPQSPDGNNSYEDIAALLHKVNGAWWISELACTEPDNPDCLGGPEYFKGLQRRFPEAPGEIFPGF